MSDLDPVAELRAVVREIEADVHNLDSPLVGIYAHKVRHKWVGKPGKVDLQYDRVTGRYSEVNRTPYGAARGWNDD
jgi:hypothetical protein